jgi:hypothetical protein
MRSGKSEPADQETDGIIGGLGNGIQKGNIFGPDRFDVVHESSQKKREKGEEKWEGEKIVCENETGETDEYPIQQKGFFPDLSFDKRPVFFGWVVNIEWSIGYFVYDVIGCGDSPREEKCREGFPDKRHQRGGGDLRSIQKKECRHSRKDGQTPGPPFQPHGSKIRIHLVYLLKRIFRMNLAGLILSEFFLIKKQKKDFLEENSGLACVKAGSGD